MELELTRDVLRFERFVNRSEEQVTIEGEAVLPGSMRDAVTVLNVQADAHLTNVQAGREEAGVRGRACFRVLYTQGDLTRIRKLETTCDFSHTFPIAGVSPQMRATACILVQETEGTAAGGRITLRAALCIIAEVFEAAERDAVTAAALPGAQDALQTRSERIVWCVPETLGQGETTVREAFDLPQKLGAGEVLDVTAAALPAEISGGSGRVGISGVIEVRVLHRALEAGSPLLMTTHEMPYELTIGAEIPEGMQPSVAAEVIDVMADSAESDKSRTLRAEAEIRVTLGICRQMETDLLADFYSIRGPALEPQAETIEVHTFEETADVRESMRLQASLPSGEPPIGRMLAVFAQPTLAGLLPAGRRLDAEGVMSVTLIYLPVDSDIPHAVHTREPFAMTFPVEAGEGVTGYMRTIEAAPGPTTSDRAEIRCVMALHAVQHGTQRVRIVTGVEEQPEEKQERGFVLVWPRTDESRWETARRLRVAEDSLRPAGKHALLALRR